MPPSPAHSPPAVSIPAPSLPPLSPSPATKPCKVRAPALTSPHSARKVTASPTPPPLYYKVWQPQLPSTAPVFSTPSGFCWGLHLLGGTVGEASQLQQFNFAPMVAINVTAGASPNAAPVFALPGFTTIENLSILGSNQAVSLYDSVNVLFRNVCLAVNGTTGQTNNTNTLIRHNNIGLNSSGDACVSLAGVFNPVVIEQNVCTLAPAASLGYVFKKDCSGNYPDNDEIYGNDCETSSTAFGQVCYDIIGARSITFGPNNRCEKVYNCLEFPSDGSANGIHVIDPYLSISNTAQLLPNEPSTSTIAID